MTSLACGLYGLFITCIISTLFGITTLILAIVFEYIGFVSSAIWPSACAQPYLVLKNNYLTVQLDASFIGILVALLTDFIVFVLVVLSVRKYRNLSDQNNLQQNHRQFQQNVFSRAKYNLAYILLSLGTLGNVICFGQYLSFIIQAQQSTCYYISNYIHLLTVTIIAGLWLSTFLIRHCFVLSLTRYFKKGQLILQRRAKYVDLVNLTQQPQCVNNIEQRRQEVVFRQGLLVDEDKQRNVYQDQRGRNKYEDKFVGKYDTKMRPINSLSTQKEGQLNPGRTYLSPGQRNQHPGNVQGQEQITGNNISPPMRQLRPQQSPQKQTYKQYAQQVGRQTNQQPGSNNANHRANGHAQSNRYRQQEQNLQFKNFQRSPQEGYQNALNSGDGKHSYRQDQDTKGQLVFYKKARDLNRGSQYGKNEESHSGQTPFKSPSRFQHKFAQQQLNYLNKNTKKSILPAGNKIQQVGPKSRKKIYEQNHPPGFTNQQSPPNQGKAKPRQGLLTNFIRGKFS